MPILPSSSSPLDSASQPTLSSAVESSRAVLAADRRRRTLRRRVLWTAIALAVAAIAGRSILLARRPPPVEVETVVAQTAERTLAVLARVRPLLQNQILPLTGGRLIDLPLEEGESFRRGDLLASVDDREASALLAQAQARVQEEQANLAQLETDLRRAEALGAQGLVPLSEFEAARAAVGRSRGVLAFRQQAVSEQRARLDSYRLTAPFDGRVLRRPVDPGQIVSTQTVLYEVATSDDAELEAEVDEQFVRALREGMEARVALDPATSREVLAAHVSLVSTVIDRETGAASVRLRFDRPPAGALPAGLSVDVNIVIERRAEALTVPRSAVLGLGTAESRRVLVAAAADASDGPLVERVIEVAEWPAARLLVESGLAAGDRVVLEPRTAPRGRRVRASERRTAP